MFGWNWDHSLITSAVSTLSYALHGVVVVQEVNMIVYVRIPSEIMISL